MFSLMYVQVFLTDSYTFTKQQKSYGLDCTLQRLLIHIAGLTCFLLAKQAWHKHSNTNHTCEAMCQCPECHG